MMYWQCVLWFGFLKGSLTVRLEKFNRLNEQLRDVQPAGILE